MTFLDVSIVNVALPSIQRGLHASSADLSWTVSGYALTFGLVLVPAGRIGDARGRRSAFLVGLTLFTLASAACGFAQDPTSLVVCRLVQGAAGGVLSPQVLGLIQLLFRGKERARAFGIFGVTLSVSTAVGPLTGGLLVQAIGDQEGWRWVFFVNLPIGVIAFVAARTLLPARTRETRQSIRGFLDAPGVVLLGAGVLSLMLPLVQEQQWHAPDKWLLLVVSAVLLAAFTVWERRRMRVGHPPLVDLSLFSLRSYTLGCLIGLVYFAGFTTLFFIDTIFVQQGLNYTALEAGLAVTPFALGSTVSAEIGAKLVNGYGRRLIAAGLAIVVPGFGATILAVSIVHGRGVGIATAAPMLLGGLGSGLVISPNVTLTLSEIPVTRAGIAAGVQQTGQRVGAAAGIALSGAVFFDRLAASGDWAHAVITGLWIEVGLVAIALALALTDVLMSRVHSFHAADSMDPVSTTGKA
jgi:EmrB/QacA subfamily drug resistance transporter